MTFKNHIFPEKKTTEASIEGISHIMMKKKIFKRRKKSPEFADGKGFLVQPKSILKTILAKP